MLKDELVSVKLGSNMKYYENLGYIIPKYKTKRGYFSTPRGQLILVSSHHLLPHAENFITAICDNANCYKEDEIKHMYYTNYIKKHNGNYHCRDCRNISIRIKTIDDIDFSILQNRINQLHKYIEQYGIIDGISNKNVKLYNAIRRHDKDLFDFVEKCGYNKEDVFYAKPKLYYNDKNNVIEEILNFINKHNRFPRKNDFNTPDLPMGDEHIYKHWEGYNDVKKELNYTTKNDLIDNRGDYNRSLIELYVANWFIAQGLKDKYMREQHPFPKEKGNFRSDFTFYLEEGKELHIEVWGYKKENTSKIGTEYSKTRIKKEMLYQQHVDSITLIELESEDLQRNYNIFSESLYNKFHDIFKLPLKTVMWESIKSYNESSEEEIVNMLLLFRNDGTFPASKLLKQTKNGRYLLGVVTRKYKGLKELAEKYGYQVKYKYYKININNIYIKLNEVFTLCNKIPTKADIDKISKEDYTYIGISNYFKKNNGKLNCLLKFSEYCIVNNIYYDFFNLKDICTKTINKEQIFSNMVVKDEDITLANGLLQKYNTNIESEEINNEN